MLKDGKNEILHPFVKWAGGKTQLLEKLYFYKPKKFNVYYEPFVGGGSLFLSLEPKRAVINDSNEELIDAYLCLADDELFSKMIEQLRQHESNHSKEYYYQVRDMDKDSNFHNLPIYIRAARMIYLNKSCFNGLYRVNSNGHFNVPSNHAKKVHAFDEQNMVNLHDYFKENDILILNGDYEEAIKDAKKEDFVYFDPPYDTIDDKDSFTSYTKNGFGKDEQIRLSNVFERLNEAGVYVMLSNSNTMFINDLYADFNIHIVNARRNINSKADGRGEVEEVIITNY